MVDLNKFIIDPGCKIDRAMKILNDNIVEYATLFVVASGRLIGTVSDSDLRRAVINNQIGPEDPILKITHKTPVVLRPGQQLTDEQISRYKVFRYLPVVDDDRKIIRFLKVSGLNIRPNNVILMAGGLGMRLRPLTNEIPKPMLKVGGKPMLQIIIEQFREYNIKKFFISVNYRLEVIKEYFRDGEFLDVEITYIEENEKLGTVGSLSLIDYELNTPFFVMNSDILANINFEKLLDFHMSSGNDATMCTVEYKVNIPYGVIRSENNRIMEIVEKPTQKYFVNGGIYLLNPSVKGYIPKNEFFDMPDLLKRLIESDKLVGNFVMEDYWLDIGHHDDYIKANMDYGVFFKNSKERECK